MAPALAAPLGQPPPFLPDIKDRPIDIAFSGYALSKQNKSLYMQAFWCKMQVIQGSDENCSICIAIGRTVSFPFTLYAGSILCDHPIAGAQSGFDETYAPTRIVRSWQDTSSAGVPLMYLVLMSSHPVSVHLVSVHPVSVLSSECSSKLHTHRPSFLGFSIRHSALTKLARFSSLNC